MANQDFEIVYRGNPIRTIGVFQTNFNNEVPFTGTLTAVTVTFGGFSSFSGPWNLDFKLNGALMGIDISIDGSDTTLQATGLSEAVTERDIIEPFITSLGGGSGSITVPIYITYTFTPTAKTTPVNADTFGITDSAASNAPKSLTYANLKTALTTDIVNPAVAGLSWKQAVRVATTADGTMATAFDNGSTVDGVTLATGDRILIKNQSAGAENGIYIVAASGAPTRATDADTAAEILQASVYVQEGTANADKQFVLTTNAPITLGSTSLTFAEFTSGSSYTDEQAQDAVGAMVDSSLVYVDATPLLTRAALTGDVTASQGSNATTIANNAVTTAKIADANVTLAKLANAAANSKLLGSGAAGSGAPYAELTLGTNLSMSGTTLNASGGGAVASDTIWDAKGDLAVGTGADTAQKLTVGTNGHFLKADSTQTTGLIWAAVPGGGDLLSTNNLSDVASASTSRTNLGLAIGTNVQAWDTLLDSIGALTDPNADKILFWDDSAGNFAWLEPNTNLSITGTDLDASGGGTETWDTIFKTSDEARTNAGTGTTLTDDGQLVSGTLTAASRYWFKIYVKYSAESGTPGFKFRYNLSQTPVNSFFKVTYISSLFTLPSTTAPAWSYHGGASAAGSTLTATGSFFGWAEYSGWVQTHATLTSVLAFQWAQNASSADDSTLYSGSHLMYALAA